MLQKGSMKLHEIFRDECGSDLSKLGLGPVLEHSSRSRFGNREGCGVAGRSAILTTSTWLQLNAA